MLFDVPRHLPPGAPALGAGASGCALDDLLHSPALAPGASVRMRLAAQRQVQVSKSSVETIGNW
jgi:hypothetical protein